MHRLTQLKECNPESFISAVSTLKCHHFGTVGANVECPKLDVSPNYGSFGSWLSTLQKILNWSLKNQGEK